MLEIFDRLGNIDKAAIADREADIRALTEPQQKALLVLVEANDEALEGEQRLADARKNVRELSIDHDAKLEAHNMINRPLQPEQALREVLAVHRGEKPVSRGTSKAQKAAKVALHSAIVALAEMRGELITATTAFRILEKQRGEAIVAWLQANPARPTQLDIAREHALADANRRLAEKHVTDEQNRQIAAIRGTDPEAPAEWAITRTLSERVLAKRRFRQVVS